MKRKERLTRFKVGIAYLEKTGLNLFVNTSSFGRISFEPGSYFENKEKETLPIPFSVKSREGIIYNLSEELRKRYQISTEVDLQRLVRICAILTTDFEGPVSDDTPDILFKNLRIFMKEKSNRTGWEITQSLITLGDILNYRKERSFSEYYHLAWILNLNYNLWKEREPFESYTI
ncbi:MAG: hypothetical protein ACFFDW_08450 [Candidatus Thorarchaeota archaeon]